MGKTMRIARRVERNHATEMDSLPAAVGPVAGAPALFGPQHELGKFAIFPKLAVNPPEDHYEREADETAALVVGRIADAQSAESSDELATPTGGLVQRSQSGPVGESRGTDPGVAGPRTDPGGLAVADDVENNVHSARGEGSGLPGEVRQPMERAFGADFSAVRVHSDSRSDALSRSLNARAFTTKSDIFFRSGEYQPGQRQGQELLAHELTHVVQQGAAIQRKPAISTAPADMVQRDLAQSLPTAMGGFEINMIKSDGALATPPTPSGLSGQVRFIPSATAPYSNQIGLIQIVKLTDGGGKNVSPISLPPGRDSLRTVEDSSKGVEGGFFTDVLHQGIPGAPGPAAAPGSALPPQYAFGTGANPANPVHNGFPTNTNGASGQKFGFKRSETDLRGAELFDGPGTADPTANLDFRFETVAKGEDVMTVFGALKWGFDLRAGKVVNEHVSAEDGQSATFDEALERHRDFYTHEPVTFYFDFDSDILNSGEDSKIDTFLDYLRRFPDVQLQVNGFADISGGASRHNQQLSGRREQAVRDALVGKGIEAGKISLLGGKGASTHATDDAASNQNDEANRRGNRRVELTFIHTATPAGPPSP